MISVTTSFRQRAKVQNWMPILPLLLCAPAIAPVAGAQLAAAPTHGAANTIDIGQLGEEASVSLRVGDVMRVLLSSNPSTGYSWQPSANNDAILQAGSVRVAVPPGAKPGTGGVATLTFTAKATGKDQLVLAYRRPWEKNTAPAKSYTLDVAVADQDASQGAPAVTPKGVLIDTYTGKLPCGDCSGTFTTIALYAAGPNQFLDTYYVTTMKYLDAPKGNVTTVTAGEWTLNRGSVADPNATVYCLYSAGGDGRTNYQIKGDSLIALDPDLKVIQSPFNMNLTKVQ
jgi:inhibitor of cysteine peptidase